MSVSFSVFPGKIVRSIARTRGGGSALPGLFIEKIDPSFMRRTLESLPHGVVLISGTNGKTTTTKMVVELLESQGLKVFTNRTGSNFTRGIAAELIGEVDLLGRLDADIAVIELDEAYAVHFVRQVAPRACLLLNVMRDQLDRFGEIDHTAALLERVAATTTDHIVINREDPRLRAIGVTLPEQKVVYYGLQKNLRAKFPNDDELHGGTSAPSKVPAAFVMLESIKGQTAHFRVDGKRAEATLQLDGLYNIYNAAGALALVFTILGKKAKSAKLYKALERITPAFGRGEVIDLGGFPCELVLVKNPSGFQLGLSSFSPAGYATMIAINDNYADGRDMSWLWDVDFSSLAPEGVALVSGVRAYDMALRLQYDEVTVDKIEQNIVKAVDDLARIKQPRRIYCTYTAMLAIRSELAKRTNVERVL